MSVSDLPACPQLSAPAAGLPAGLQAEVERSAKAFEEKLGMLRHMPAAQEWIRDYRAEAIRLVQAGVKAGQNYSAIPGADE